MKGTKAYKVVTAQRNSCIVKGTPFNIKYKKGTTVRAHEKTIGIMCFDSLYQAERFRNCWDKNGSWKILAVMGYKKRRFSLISILPKFGYGALKRKITQRLNEFYKIKKREYKSSYYVTDIIDGCVLFDKVEVLT